MAKGTQIAQAYVQIIPTTDGIQSGIEKSLNGVDKEFGVAGIAAGTAFGNAISNVVQEAVTKIAKFASDTLKQSLNATADYEQLAGGIEKIFSGMDTSKIANDAKNAYKELGMSANEYLNSINQIGATFKASMGSEEAYETARKGLSAISDYASGTGRDIGELSEKYKMITRAASSYQSIADQFSGILPATSQQFLEASQSAGILDSSYRKLTDVPLAEYQQAVTAMLEKGVGALQLTGNTAKEATTTLSGSLNQMKKAWDNMIMSFTNPDIDTAEMTSNFINALHDFLDNLGPALQEAAPALAEALGTVISELGPILADALEKAFIEAMKRLPEVMGRQLRAILNALKSNLNANGVFDGLVLAASRALGQISRMMSGGIIDFDAITTGIADVIYYFDEIKEAAGRAIQVFQDIFDTSNRVFGGIADIVGRTSRAVNDFFRNAANISRDSLNQIGSIARDAISQIRDAFSGLDLSNFNLDEVGEAFRKVVEIIKRSLNDAINVVKDWGTKMISAGRNAVEKFVTGIIDGLKRVVERLKNAGHEMAAGIIEGFTSRLERLKRDAIDSVEKLVEGIKDALQIHSPSRLLRDQVGAMMARGLEIGWTQEMSRVNAGINADIEKEYSFGQNTIIKTIGNSSSNISSGNSITNDLVRAIQNITVQSNVKLEGDAGKLFTAIQDQNRVFRNSTGRSAFA